MSWYTTGTVSLTNGSKTVTGVGTKWTNSLIGVCAGQMLILKTANTIEICEIASVQSDTQLTLANQYSGVSKKGVSYEIPTAPNVSIEALALRISEMLNYYQQQMNSWQSILTGTGDITLTAPDGKVVTIKSQKALIEAINNAVKKSGDTMTGELSVRDKLHVLNKKGNGMFIHAQENTDNVLFVFVNNGKSTYKIAYNQSRNSIEFRALDDVKVNDKSVLKAGDGGLLSYTQTIKDVFAPDLKTGFYRFDANSINTPCKGLGYMNKISWNANESVVIAYMYNSNRVFTGFKDKNSGEVKYAELMKAGDYGVGAPTGISIQNLDEHLNSGFYGTNTGKIPNLSFAGGGSAASLLVLPSESPHWKVEQLSVVNGRIPRIYYRTDTKNDGKQNWYEAITTANVGDYTHQFLGDLANKSLNDLTGTVAGIYFQGRNTSATAENSYPIAQAGTLNVMKNGADGEGCCQIYTTYRSARQFIRNYRGGTKTWEPWVEQITTANSTVDSNGFYKKASPILRLYGTKNIELIAGFTVAGCALVNDLATGVIATRIDVGHYEICGSLGFAKEGWYIQLPEDANGNKKFFADYLADENGIITIKTFTKKFDFEKCEIVAGEPVDITDGRWIDVRLEMPVVEVIENEDLIPSTLNPVIVSEVSDDI